MEHTIKMEKEVGGMLFVIPMVIWYMQVGGKIENSFDAFQAEVIACWHGVRTAMELGM